jgi:hypothetical protein
MKRTDETPHTLQILCLACPYPSFYQGKSSFVEESRIEAADRSIAETSAQCFTGSRQGPASTWYAKPGGWYLEMVHGAGKALDVVVFGAFGSGEGELFFQGVTASGQPPGCQERGH